jgi:hypothetical protein
MLDREKDGNLQVCAALSLLNNSRLITWKAKLAPPRFEPVEQNDFERSWREDLDPEFGRLICWISFSAGAEFLAKGVCLVNGIEIRKPKLVKKYPTENESIEAWAPRFLELCKRKEKGTVPTIDYGSLDGLMRDKKPKGGLIVPSPFSQLCESKKVNATATQRHLLFAAYELLRESIRNRDMHAYAPNVRDSHFNLVPQLFAECFNLLASWIPGGPSTLTKWRADAKQLIESL